MTIDTMNMHRTMTDSNTNSAVGTSDSVSNKKLLDIDSLVSFEFVTVVCTTVVIVSTNTRPIVYRRNCCYA